MINVELSNIWSCVSLPNLLSSEQALFEAHLKLRRNQPGFDDFLGWLGCGDAMIARTIGAVERAADTICRQSQVLVVAGMGESWLGARAAVRLLGKPARDGRPAVLFVGDRMGSDDYLALFDRLEGKDFCLQLIMPEQPEPECAIASRAVRWMMERRYGKEAKGRIFVTARPDSPMAVMAKEEGCTFLPMPTEPGGAASALTAATLLPLAVAGVEPLAFLEGAANAYRAFDLRAFENPVWMYAGARYALCNRGRTNEFLLTADGRCRALGAWWQQAVLRRMCRGGMGVLPAHFSLPQSTDALDAMLTGGTYPVFETVLRPKAAPQQRLHVEMDWKDYDGLGYLTDTTLEDVAEKTLDAFVESQAAADVPVILLECDALDAPQAGELLYFFELANAICAAASGVDPLAPMQFGPARTLAGKLLGKLE